MVRIRFHRVDPGAHLDIRDLGGVGDVGDGVLDEILQVHQFGPDREGLVVQAGHDEQVLDQRSQPIRLTACRVDQLLGTRVGVGELGSLQSAE